MAEEKNATGRNGQTLGEIRVEGFDQDLAIAKEYQAFSAELLRMALLGIAGIAYLIKIQVAPHGLNEQVPSLTPQAFRLLEGAAIALALCAGTALAHRYVASDALAYQLRIGRLCSRKGPFDKQHVAPELLGRNRRFRISGPLLLISASSLAIGAGLFVLFLGQFYI